MPTLDEQMASLEVTKAPKKPVQVKQTKSQMLQKKKMEEEKKKQEAAAKKGARRKLLASPKPQKVATPPRVESPKPRTPSPKAPSPRTPSPRPLSPRTPSPRPSTSRRPSFDVSPLQGFDDLGVCPLIDDAALDDSELPSWELDDYLNIQDNLQGSPQAALRSWQRLPRPGVGRRRSASPDFKSRPDQLIPTPPPGYKQVSPSGQRMVKTQLERAEKLRQQREEERAREERRQMQESTLSGGERSLGMETPPSFEDFELSPPRRKVCFRTPTSADKRSPPNYVHEFLEPKAIPKKIPKKVKEVKLTKSQMLQKKKLEADAKKKETGAKRVETMKKQRFKRLEKKKEEPKPPSPPRPVTPPRVQTPPRQPTPPPPSPELSPFSPRPFLSPESAKIAKIIEERDKAVPRRSPRAVDTAPSPCPSKFSPYKVGPNKIDFLWAQEPIDLNVAGDLDISWSPVRPASPPKQSPLKVPPRRPGDFRTPPSADRRPTKARRQTPGSAPERMDTIVSPGMLQWQRAQTPPNMADDLLGNTRYNFYPTIMEETSPGGLHRPLVPGQRIGGPVGSLLLSTQGAASQRSSFLDSEELSDLYASDSDASPCPKRTPVMQTPLKRVFSPKRFGSNWLTPTKQPPRPFPRIPSGGIPTPPVRRLPDPEITMTPQRLPSDRLVEVSPMDPRWQLDFEPPSVGGTPCSCDGTPPPRPAPQLTETQQQQLNMLDELDRQLQEMEDRAAREQQAKEAAAEAARLEAARREAAKPKVKQTKAQMLREEQRKIEAEAEKKKLEQARLRELKNDAMAKKGRQRLEKSKKGQDAGAVTPCPSKERAQPTRELTPMKLKTPDRGPEPVGEWQQLEVQVPTQGYQAEVGSDVFVASPATQNMWGDLSPTSDGEMPPEFCSGSPIGMSSFEEELYEYERDAKRRGIVLTPSPPPKPPTPKPPTPPPKQPTPPKKPSPKKKKKYEVRKNRYQLLREKKIQEEKDKAMIEWDEKERKICKKMAKDYWKKAKERDKMLKEAEQKAADWDAHCEREAWRIAEENWAKEVKQKQAEYWEEVQKRIAEGAQSDMTPISDDSDFERRFQYSTEYESFDSPPQDWEDPVPGPSGWVPPPRSPSPQRLPTPQRSPSPQRVPSPKPASPAASAQQVTPCEKREIPKRKRPRATKSQMLREKRFKEERAQKAKAAKEAAEADARRRAAEEAERARLALLPPAPPPMPRTPPRGVIGSPIRLGSRIDVGPHPMVGEPTFTQLPEDGSYDLEGGFEFPAEVSPVACGLPDFSSPIEISPQFKSPPLSPRSKAFRDVVKSHAYTPAKYDTERSRMKSKTLFVGNKAVSLKKSKAPTLKPVQEMALMESVMEKQATPRPPRTPTPPPRRNLSPQFSTPSTPSFTSPRRLLDFDQLDSYSPPPFSDDSTDYLDFQMRGSPPRKRACGLNFDTPIDAAHQKFAKANQQVSALLGKTPLSFTPPKPLTCGKQSDTSTALTMQSLSDFPDLDSSAICVIKRAWSDGDENKVLVEGSKMTLTRRDLLTLKEGNRPNENIVNYYLSMIQSRSKKGMGPKCYAFNSYFYPRLESDGSCAVLKWTKKVDLFEKDYIFVPILESCHWTLAVVDLKWKQLRYYDGHGNYNKKCLSNLLHYLYTEHRDKRGKCLETSQFDLQKGECPLQENHADCGVFILTIAEMLSRDNRLLNFSSADIPYLRQRITAEIMQEELLTQYKRP